MNNLVNRAKSSNSRNWSGCNYSWVRSASEEKVWEWAATESVLTSMRDRTESTSAKHERKENRNLRGDWMTHCRVRANLIWGEAFASTKHEWEEKFNRMRQLNRALPTRRKVGSVPVATTKLHGTGTRATRITWTQIQGNKALVRWRKFDRWRHWIPHTRQLNTERTILGQPENSPSTKR